MLTLKDFTKISDFEWLLEKNFRPGMVVPVKLFASEDILKGTLEDSSIEQAVNSTFLPGLKGFFCVMPDVHQGYGFPIGGVAAADFETGVISPGGIGYDINCGVRLLSSVIPFENAAPLLEDLALLLYQNCPSGVGKHGSAHLSSKDFQHMCIDGSKWALKNGQAEQLDIEFTEDNGSISGADLSAVSPRAIERGIEQTGSLGSGNHFIEVDVVDEISDEKSAQIMGLVKGCLVVQIHTGSRGFGHQICTDYVREFQSVMSKYRINVPDRELVCAPIQSKEGQRYLAAMRCAANFAFCNRQILASVVRDTFESVFYKTTNNYYLRMVYDLAHNIGKIETHKIQGKERKVCVHRKGATRAFPPGNPDIPEKYLSIGQPVLIPGSMGTASWVMTGTDEGMEKSFGSCCHGAGRVMSRSQAKKCVRGDVLLKQLKNEGIFIKAGSLSGLAEEAPDAYKNIDLVVEAAVGAGLAKKVARLHPVAVIKG
jgi:tRNA-splicing ligase RtcB (3'-phosphate/5'-hydroxy nucleic acid ligase)